MKKMKKVAALIIGVAIAICGFNMTVYADRVELDIENTLDVSECRQGDTITMSINLKGSGTTAA